MCTCLTWYNISGNLFVASLVEDMMVLYNEPFNILYTIASSSNGTDNTVSEALNITIVFHNSTNIDSTNLDTNLLSVVTGNHYQLTIPSANTTTNGNYTVIVQRMYPHI